MIFSAGLGTRFKPFTDAHPKALAMVNGKSLLQRNVEYLQQYGITDVIINVHHFADQIIAAVAQNKGWGSNILISSEVDEVLETGGGLLKAQHLFIPNQAFITLNVDILTHLNIHHLIAYHQQHAPLISIGVTNRQSSRCFLFDENSKLCGWQNNSTGQQKIAVNVPNLNAKAYSCVAVFEPTVFSLIQQQGKFSLTDAYLDLAKTQTILGFEHSGDALVDVGKPESVAIAEALFN